MRVYSAALTVAGEGSLRDAAHLGRLPKTLTWPFDARFRRSLNVAAWEKTGAFYADRKGNSMVPNLLTLKIFSASGPSCLSCTVWALVSRTQTDRREYCDLGGQAHSLPMRSRSAAASSVQLSGDACDQ